LASLTRPINFNLASNGSGFIARSRNYHIILDETVNYYFNKNDETGVAQVSQPAVSPISKSAARRKSAACAGKTGRADLPVSRPPYAIQPTWNSALQHQLYCYRFNSRNFAKMFCAGTNSVVVSAFPLFAFFPFGCGFAAP
jgi:hypothetical protein